MVDIVKKVPYAKLRSDGRIVIERVRLSYPHVFEAYQGPDPSNKPRFGLVGLMPKGPEYREAKNLIRDAINAVIAENNKGQQIPAKNKFLRDGDDTGKSECEGMFTINASSTPDHPPVVYGKKTDAKTGKLLRLKKGTQDEGIIYPGCWATIMIRPWWQNNQYGKKVNASLDGVIFADDDEAFGAGRISEDDLQDTFAEYAEAGNSGFDDDLGEDDEL